MKSFSPLPSSILRPWRLALAMLGLAVSAQTPATAQSLIDLPAGPIVIQGDWTPVLDVKWELTRPAEPEVPLIQVGGVAPNGHDPRYIVQPQADGNPFGNAWHESGIETEVINALLTAHGLPASDRSRLLRWERDTIRAALFARLVAIIQKTPATRTAQEQAIYDAVTARVRYTRLRAAQASLAEFNEWQANPFGYSPPEPYEYQGRSGEQSDVERRFYRQQQDLMRMSGVTMGPAAPSYDEFIGYGVATVYDDLVLDEAVKAMADSVARSTQKTIALSVSTAVSPLIGDFIGATVGLLAPQVLQAVIPFSVRTFGAVGAGSSIAAGPFAVAVMAIVQLGFEVNNFVEASNTKSKIEEYVAQLPTMPIDLAASIQTDAGLKELYSLFLISTLPDAPATEQAPPAVAGDRQWLRAPSGTACFRPEQALQMVDQNGKHITVRLVDGWLVIKDEAGVEKMALTVEVVDSNGTLQTVSRTGNQFLLTNGTDAVEDAPAVASFSYRDWTSAPQTAKLASPGVQAAITPETLAAAEVGRTYSAALSVQNPGPGAYTWLVKPLRGSYAYQQNISPLPPGLTFSAAGVFSGRPTRAGTFSFEVHATNAPSNSHPAVQRINLQVTAQPAPVPAGMIAFYHLQDNAQDSIGSNHGSWGTFTPAYAEGITGRAASFNFATAITLPDNMIPLTGGRTIELWMKTTQFGAILGQWSLDGSSGIPAVYVDLQGKLRSTFFYNGDGTTLTSTASVNDGLWHHVAITNTGTQESMFIDGALVASRANAGVLYGSGSYAYTLGVARAEGWPGWNGATMFYSGQMDEVSLYNRALTPQEIQTAFTAGGSGKAVVNVGTLSQTSATVGTWFDAALTAFFGSDVTESSIAGATGLPHGLRFEGMNLRGTPRAAGVYVFKAIVTTAAGYMGERQFTITVSGPKQPTPDGLLAWWPGQNNLQSLPGNAYPLTGTVTYTTGFSGQAFNFNGSTLNLPGGLLPMGGADATFETWFRTSESGTLLGRTSAPHTGAVLMVRPDGKLSSQLCHDSGAAPLVSAVSVNDGAWHHVAVVQSIINGRAQEVLYLDGQVAAQGIGRTPSSGTPFYHFGGSTCQLDEPAVYGRALTAAEVAAVFTAGGNGKSRLSLLPATLPEARTGEPFSQSLSALALTGGNPAASYSLTAGVLPPGLTLSAGGVISGSPRSGGTWAFTLCAQDATGQTGARNYTLRVAGVPSVIPPAAVALWRGENNAFDSIGTQHATLTDSATGSVSYTDGISGRAFLFDGSGARAVIPATAFPSPAIQAADPFTFETWFRTSRPGVILGRQDADFPQTPLFHVPALYVGQNGRLYAQLFASGNNTPLSSSTRVDDGQQHHVAVTFAAGVQQVYLDGVLIATRSGFTQVHDSIANGYRYQLGTGYTRGWPQGNDTWMHFTGIIDEPATYARALTATEIAAIHTAGDAGKLRPANVVATVLPAGRVDQDYRVAGILGAVRVKFSPGLGSMPPGLSLAEDGVLYGTPEVAGFYRFNVAALSGDGAWSLLDWRILIDGVPAARLRDAGWFRGENSLTGFVNTEALTPAGSVTYTQGRVGQALRFTGAQSLAVPSVPFPAPAGEWSFETWFRTSASGIILSQEAPGVGYVPMLYVDVDGLLHAQPYWSGSNVTLKSTVRVDDGEWHHAAFSYASGTRRLFLDGREAATSSAPGVAYAASYTYRLGNGTSAGWPVGTAGTGFNGLIDDAQFYDFAITADYVREIRAAGGLGKSQMTLSDTLPDTYAGWNYNGSITTLNQPPDFTYSVVRGRLPAGLNLASDGTVTGAATMPGVFNFTVQSTSSQGFRNVRRYSIAVESGIRFRPAGLTNWWRGDNPQNWATGGAPVATTGTYSAGISGQAFSFDGIGSSGQFAALPAGTLPTPGTSSPFTVELWLRANGPGGVLGQRSALGGSGIPVSGYVPMIYVGVDGKLRVQTVWTGTVQPVTSPDVVIDGTWHHVASTFDGSAMRVYLDGQLIGSLTGISSVGYAPSYALELGRVFTQGWGYGGDGWEHFSGQVDELTTYSRALSAAEIARITACGTAGKSVVRFTPASLTSGVRGRPYWQPVLIDGAAPLTFSAVAGTLPPGFSAGIGLAGGFGVEGIPTTTGTFTFRLQATNDSILLNGPYAQVQQIEEDFTLTIDPLTGNAAYDMWAGAAGLTGPGALPGASPRGDVPNLLKFASNLDPNASDARTLTPGGTAGLPDFRLVSTPAGRFFRCEYFRRRNSGLTYTPETTTDLQSFTPFTAVPSVTSVDDAWERVILDEPATGERMFGRVRVQQ